MQLQTGSGVDADAVRRFLDVLTLDLRRCPDGPLTPFVPADDCFVPMSALIVYASPHRNLLAILQSDPASYGDAGRGLGDEGERATLDVLQRMKPGTSIAKRVKLVRTDGSPAGDFDLVVCDPASRKVLVMEIKWSISSDGNVEVYRTEQLAIEKRTQVSRLRQEFLEGKAQVRWPKGWPDASRFELRWYVLTRDVSPRRKPISMV